MSARTKGKKEGKRKSASLPAKAIPPDRHSDEGSNQVAPPSSDHEMGGKDGRIRPAYTPLGELCERIVSQEGPKKRKKFVYVDIGSIDRETKQIVEPKTLSSSSAPGRARQVLKAGDVLVSMTRPNLNAVALVPPELDGAIGSTGLHVLRARDVEPKFLFYVTQTSAFIDAMSQKVQGALYPAVRPRDISSFCIRSPSRNEQRQIIAQIEEQFTRLDSGVTLLRRVHANLKRFRAVVLQEACEGRLVATEVTFAKGQNRGLKVETGKDLLKRILSERSNTKQIRGAYRKPVAPVAAALPPLPEFWTWATIDQLLRISAGLSYGILKPGRENPNGVPMIRVMDIGEGKLTGTKIVKVDPALSGLYKRTILESGDILLAVMATIGRCMVVPEQLVGANVNRAIAVIKPTRLVSSQFLEIAIRSPRMQNLFRKNKIGSAQPRINLADLRAYCVPLPPMSEQLRIVNEVDRLLSMTEVIENAVANAINRSKRLRQAVLQRAFAEFVPQFQEKTGRTSRFQENSSDSHINYTISKTEIAAMTGSKRPRSILSAIAHVRRPVTPEELFRLCGRDPARIEDVEAFFEELGRLSIEGQIEELRRGKTTVTLRVRK